MTIITKITDGVTSKLLKRKRICNDKCKRFQVKKPTGIGRYEAGHGRCQTCDVWIDYRGAHTKDGMSATADSVGWYCNCCNYRIRRNPRNIKYKAKLHASNNKDTPNIISKKVIDLSYFNKQRALMLKTITKHLDKKQDSFNMSDFLRDLLSESRLTKHSIEYEFNVSIDKIIELAYDIEQPNKISMIKEFERVKNAINRTPTKLDIDTYSAIPSSKYEAEFDSWEHFLERLGYDPWYRDSEKVIVEKDQHDLEQSSSSQAIIHLDKQANGNTNNNNTLNNLKNKIRDSLKHEPEMMDLFNNLDHSVEKYGKKALSRSLHVLDS